MIFIFLDDVLMNWGFHCKRRILQWRSFEYLGSGRCERAEVVAIPALPASPVAHYCAGPWLQRPAFVVSPGWPLTMGLSFVCKCCVVLSGWYLHLPGSWFAAAPLSFSRRNLVKVFIKGHIRVCPPLQSSEYRRAVPRQRLFCMIS